MTFIDNLAIELDLLILTTVAIFYTGVWVGWHHMRGERDRAVRELRGGSLVMGLLGSFLLLLGIWGEFVWPLPAQYNLLFYDPTVMIGLLLVGFAALVWLSVPTRYIGIVSLVAGAGVIYYASRAYLLGLTTEPLAMLAMFVSFGIVAILAMPVTTFLDWRVVGPDPFAQSSQGSSAGRAIPVAWKVVVGLFLAWVVAAGIGSIVIGFGTVWSHLASAP